jgi:hypothetical protein
MNGKSSWRCRNFPFGLLLRAQERSRRELVRRSLLALTTSLGASNGKCAEAFLMAPTILIECGFEALRHSRLLALLHQGRVYRHRTASPNKRSRRSTGTFLEPAERRGRRRQALRPRKSRRLGREVWHARPLNRQRLILFLKVGGRSRALDAKPVRNGWTIRKLGRRSDARLWPRR